MLIGYSCWVASTGTNFLAGDDSAIGGGSTPPELDKDCVKSTTGARVGAMTGP